MFLAFILSQNLPLCFRKTEDVLQKKTNREERESNPQPIARQAIALTIELPPPIKLFIKFTIYGASRQK